MISKEVFTAHLIERHGKLVQRKISSATVGIAGIGGLGSNIAMALARLGVGKLILVDHDHVELSNINRQAYCIKHLGQPKITALEALIKEVNPFVEIETHQAYINRENALSFFESVDIVVEAFDNPASKAALCESILVQGKHPIVAASGMAGAVSANKITTKKQGRNFYLCGDGVTDVKDAGTLMASRVLVAAGHQAHMVLRLIIGEETV